VHLVGFIKRTSIFTSAKPKYLLKWYVIPYSRFKFIFTDWSKCTTTIQCMFGGESLLKERTQSCHWEWSINSHQVITALHRKLPDWTQIQPVIYLNTVQNNFWVRNLKNPVFRNIQTNQNHGESNSSSASHKIPCILWHLQLHYYVQRIPTTCPCSEPD
jgi:hypothetical protein